MIYKKAKNYIDKLYSISTLLNETKDKLKFSDKIIKSVRSYSFLFDKENNVNIIFRKNSQTLILERLIHFSTCPGIIYARTNNSKYKIFNNTWDVHKLKEPFYILFEVENWSVENEFQLSTVYNNQEMFTYYCIAYMSTLEMNSFNTTSTDIQLFTRIPKAIQDIRIY